MSAARASTMIRHAPKNSRGNRLRILITAGPTREYIDRVRYISNESSGKMGFALAAAAAQRGHRVTLVHGPVELSRPAGVRVVPIMSAADMLAACRRAWPLHDALIMAAAVADYAPQRRERTKMKKSAAGLKIDLRPTVDVLAELAAGRRADQVVVGFALEDRSPRRSAEAKLRRKDLDAIVLNKPAAMSANRSAVEILVRGGRWERVSERAKTRLAPRIVRLVEQLRIRISHTAR